MYATAGTTIDNQVTQPLPQSYLPPEEGVFPQAELIGLLSALQTSLEPLELINTFTGHLIRHISFDSWLYRNPLEGVEGGRGVRSGESIEWELRIGDESLGTLLVYSRSGFNRDEVDAADQLIWSLIFPLRNALRHQRAIATAYSDPLTGARNRRAFDDQLHSEISAAARSHQPLSLLVVDIDHFKSINDHFGHAIGDMALRALVETSARTIRDGDLLYRYGGEEFVILLRNTDEEGARRLAERLRSR